MRDRRKGNIRLYSIDTRGLGALREYLNRYWDTALAAFADAAREEKGRRR